MSMLQLNTSAACPGCCREWNLPSPQMVVPSLQSVLSSTGGKVLSQQNILSPKFIYRYLAMNLPSSGSVRRQKVILILLQKAWRPENYSSVPSASQANHSSTSPKETQRLVEDIVPKRDKVFPLYFLSQQNPLYLWSSRSHYCSKCFFFPTDFRPSLLPIYSVHLSGASHYSAVHISCS